MLEAWFFIAAVLLVLSGGMKLIDPAPTRGALKAAGLPAGTPGAYAVGLVEVGAGLAGTIVGGWASLTVALIYTSFAVFVGYALWRELPIQSCGCFGRDDTPPTWGHVVFNSISALSAVAVFTAGRVPVEILVDQPLGGVPYVAFVALGVWVVYLLLAELPRTLAAGR